MFNIDTIKNKILQNTSELNHEFKRLFHGRGGVWKKFKFLTIDSIDTILTDNFAKLLNI
jgi:23S rRNA (cytosine1962-C5)-methyltransferase